jgi:hypothetical protein
MGPKVTIAARTLYYTEGGGHIWVYLNWALSLQAIGCEVTWLETFKPNTTPQELDSRAVSLRQRLKSFGINRLLFCSEDDEVISDIPPNQDLLIDINYKVPQNVASRFKKSILIDIDPGLNQVWISMGQMKFPPHHVYMTIGETVGKPDAVFPDGGISWHYTPPPVYLPAWPVTVSADSAPFTTVTHWWGALMRFGGKEYYNGKRTGFLPYMELPGHIHDSLELAIHLMPNKTDQKEREMLISNGWHLKDSHEIASTAEDYRKYVQNSCGEFSCAKPSCIHLQNAWISDRTICYLASGKPAVVEHTGPSSFLPESAGLFRFRNMQEAVSAFQTISSDYTKQSRLARALAEDYFDGIKIASKVLEIGL